MILRTSFLGEYRYGFNQGSERDDEIKGKGNSYTTFFRQYDPRLARWLSLDPVFQPHQSPYNSMDNNPIANNDVFGDKVKIGKKKKVEQINKDATIGSKPDREYSGYRKDGLPKETQASKDARTKWDDKSFDIDQQNKTLREQQSKKIEYNTEVDNKRALFENKSLYTTVVENGEIVSATLKAGKTLDGNSPEAQLFAAINSEKTFEVKTIQGGDAISFLSKNSIGIHSKAIKQPNMSNIRKVIAADLVQFNMNKSIEQGLFFYFMNVDVNNYYYGDKSYNPTYNISGNKIELKYRKNAVSRGGNIWTKGSYNIAK